MNRRAFVLAAGAALWLPEMAKAVTVAGDCASTIEVQTIQLINRWRHENGLRSLRLQDNLSASAQHKAEYMRADSWFGHNLKDGTLWSKVFGEHGYPNSWKGECIGAGQLTANNIFTAWRNSPSHNNVMLGTQFRDIGIGFVIGSWTDQAGNTYGSAIAGHFGAVPDANWQPVSFGNLADRC